LLTLVYMRTGLAALVAGSLLALIACSSSGDGSDVAVAPVDSPQAPGAGADAGSAETSTHVPATPPDADASAPGCASGTLDTSFGVREIRGSLPNTQVTLPPVGEVETALQADGKMLVLVHPSAPTPDAVLERFELSKTPVLDPSFGTAGAVHLPPSSRQVKLQPDGTIFVLEATFVGTGAQAQLHAFVHRLLPSGAADTTYGTQGIVDFPLTGNLLGYTVAADGRVFIAVASPNGALLQTATVTRLTAAGAVDPTFGTGGQSVPVRIANQVAAGPTVLLLPEPSGAVVAIQPRGPIRLEASGARDTTWGSQNQNVEGLLPAYHDATRLTDGSILVQGGLFMDYAKGQLGLFTSSGTPKTSFGNAGVMPFASLPAAVRPTSVLGTKALPGGGALVIGHRYLYGATVANDKTEVVVLKLRADGTVDATFGNGGVFTQDFNEGQTGRVVAADEDAIGGLVLTVDPSTSFRTKLAVLRVCK